MPATPVPISIDFAPQSPHAGATVAMTVTVSATLTSATFYPLYCSDPSVITDYASGSAMPGSPPPSFPASIGIPAGTDHATLALSVDLGAGREDVTIAVGNVGANMSNPANWAASGVLRVYP